MLRAVTYNLGCGGPHGAARVHAEENWASAARAEGHDLVFVQEMPSECEVHTSGGVTLAGSGSG